MSNFGVIWVKSKVDEPVTFSEFKNSRLIQRNANGIIFVVAQDNRVYYFIEGITPKFKMLDGIPFTQDPILNIVPMQNDKLLVIYPNRMEVHQIVDDNKVYFVQKRSIQSLA